MIHDQQKELNEFKNALPADTSPQEAYLSDPAAAAEHLRWHASLFTAKVIHLAEPRAPFLNANDFAGFHAAYEQEHDLSIDVDGLFGRFWLRNVLDSIRIAGVVLTACGDFRKGAAHRAELQFLVDTFGSETDQQKTISRAEFDDLRLAYEQSQSVTLSEEGLACWVHLTEQPIRVARIAFQAKPYLDHWSEFAFLIAYEDHLVPPYKGHKVAKTDLDPLHQSFRQFYPHTPAIAELTKHWLAAEGDHYYLKEATDHDVPSLFDEAAAAHYWQLLLEDESFSDDQARVSRWLLQTYGHDRPRLFLMNATEQSKKRFLDAACQLILSATDFDDDGSALRKVRIDQDLVGETSLLFHDPEHRRDALGEREDVFELLSQIHSWDKRNQHMYLERQSSRDDFKYLVDMVVTHDFEWEPTDDSSPHAVSQYPRVFRLLASTPEKPMLAWYLQRAILIWRRAVLPYLIRDRRYTALGFLFIDQLLEGPYLKEVDKAALSMKLWTKATALALFTIRAEAGKGIAPRLILQIFRQLNSTKYEIPYSQQPKTDQLSQKQSATREAAVLALFEDSLLHNHRIRGGITEYLIPSLFNELAQLFIDFEARSYVDNGTVSFPLLQWDGLAWLMKCTTYWKYKAHFLQRPADINTLTKAFFKSYNSRIEMEEVERYDFFEMQRKKSLPNWSEKIERLDRIEWIYPIYYIHDQQYLNNFISPRLFFDSTSEQYHKQNQYTTDKLRTHIGVLLQVHRRLMKPAIPYGFSKSNIQDIKQRIEQQIIDYLNRHVADVPAEGRVDLFAYMKESAFQHSDKEALLPQIARALHGFAQKEAVVEAILKSQDLAKILTMLQWVSSEGVRKIMLGKVRQSDVQAFLEKKVWTPEVQQVLQQIRNYPELINEIRQVATFWESNVSARQKAHAEELYQTRMMLAYFSKDEQALEAVSEPGSKVLSSRELSHPEHKQFYRALIRLERDPKSSYDIFRQLSQAYPHFASIAMNQMIAKIHMAKANDDQEWYTEALEEWKVYASSQADLDEDKLGSTFWKNKLMILLKLKEYGELDNAFADLDLSVQMLPEIVELKVDGLLARERVGEATMLLEAAERYHTFAGEVDSNLLKGIQSKVDGVDDVALLHTYYTRIFESPPKKLVRIFPPDLNGKQQLQSFLVAEIVSAARRLLDKVVTFSEISGEDKYNDVIEILLNAKMNPWGWYVSDQSRGGYSDVENDPEKRQPGERDLKFFNKAGTFSVCEAFIYYDQPKAKKHLKKVFDYYHQRDHFIMLIYDKNKPDLARRHWNTYLERVLPETDFPPAYKYISQEEVSEEFDLNNSAIRVARSLHRDDVVLYHIFVNIDYEVNA